MRQLASSILFAFALAAATAVGQNHDVLRVWPGDAPDEAGRFTTREIADGRKKNNSEYVRFATVPTLTPYPAPADTANGTAVVVCPGGGYNVLAWRKEGIEAAKWLNSLGVSAYVLKYRVPRRDPDAPHKAPLQDTQRAIRLVRSHAKDWSIDPGRIGVLGFSAGGNVAVISALHFDTRAYKKIDAIDDVSARPDFMIPVYCAYLGSKSDPTKLSELIRVTPRTPPMFTVVTGDDKMRGLHAAIPRTPPATLR